MTAIRVELIERPGQHTASQHKHNMGQSFSPIRPGLKQHMSGMTPWQQMYCDMSSRR